MRELIVLSGWPAAGKSTWHQTYQQAHPHKQVVVISSDAIRKELTGVYNDLSQDTLMWQLYESRFLQAYQHMDSGVIILDSTCLSNRKRLHWVENYPAFDAKTLVIVQADLQRCRQRNAQRQADKIIPDEAVVALHGYFQPPNQEVEAAFDAIVYVQTT